MFAPIISLPFLMHVEARIDLTLAFPGNSMLHDFVYNTQQLSDFIHFEPNDSGLTGCIADRQQSFSPRETLVEVLLSQYQGITLHEKVVQNIESLRLPHTFTVTTGQQLCLLTGPLYTTFKILSAINLSEKLAKDHPDKQFVPIFWMASEDHDVEEINHFYLFGKKFAWDTLQKGAVGNFNTEDIHLLLQSTGTLPDWVVEIYKDSKSLSEATRKLVHALYGKYGLVILDPNDSRLKHAAAHLFDKELHTLCSATALHESNTKLSALGYKSQISGRDINLFYLEPGSRKRILKKDNVLVTEEGSVVDARRYENLSPNVVLRPIYQEMLLPNVAYIGGPAEVAYWLQLRGVFEAFGMKVPVLMPRFFGLCIANEKLMKWKNSGLDISLLFGSEQQIKSEFLKTSSSHSLDLEAHHTKLSLWAEDVAKDLGLLDSTLSEWWRGQHAEIAKVWERVAPKMRKHLEVKKLQSIQQLLQIKSKLWADNLIQERRENIFTFLINNPYFLNDLKPLVQAESFSMNVVTF